MFGIGVKTDYLAVTRLDITFTVSVVSQFLLAPRTTHLEVIVRILRYLKKALERDIYSGHEHTRVADFSDAN